MGAIIGFDLVPFLHVAETRGYPVVLIAELLQAAECGMLEAINNAPISADAFSQNIV